jgi:quercetin dioxygenase-like cupin family protein
MSHFPKQISQLPKFDGAFAAHRLEARDCDVLFASYPAGTSIPAHDHDTENLGVITQGELILTVAGEDRRYRPGDWYHIPANARHAARFDEDTSEIEFWFRPPPHEA